MKRPVIILALLPVLCTLLCLCSTVKVQRTDAQHTVMGAAEIDSSTYRFIAPYKKKLDVAMNEVIGFAPEALVKKLPESNLGNFFSDLMLAKARTLPGVDTLNLLALFNYGGLRTSVPQGEVRVGNMYEIMPFENQLALVKLKGSALQKVLDALAEKGGTPAAGIRFVITNKKAQNIFINQTKLDTAGIYTIVTSDFLANGGDKFFLSDKPVPYTSTGLLLRDILIEHCRNFYKQNKPISAQTDGRISVAE